MQEATGTFRARDSLESSGLSTLDQRSQSHRTIIFKVGTFEGRKNTAPMGPRVKERGVEPGDPTSRRSDVKRKEIQRNKVRLRTGQVAKSAW